MGKNNWATKLIEFFKKKKLEEAERALEEERRLEKRHERETRNAESACRVRFAQGEGRGNIIKVNVYNGEWEEVGEINIDELWEYKRTRE